MEYGKYLNITGRYEDTSSNSLRYTPLIIKIKNITYITKTDNEGYFSYNYLINRLGNNTLTVTYPGNARYVGATNSTTFLAIKINEDLNKEIVITKTITTTNGKPDISK